MSTTDQGYFSKYRLLMAKTGRNPDEEWLPLWMHLKDTAGIMKKLANKWIRNLFWRGRFKFRSVPGYSNFSWRGS